jgi:peroxiredoxin
MSDKSPPSKPLKHRVLRILLEVLLLMGCVYLIHLWQTRDSVTGPAPSLVGQTLQGERFDLAELRGQPALVHFWATWCPVCQLESGAIDGLMGDYPLITVAMQSGSEAAIRNYMSEHEVGFPVISDPQGGLASTWGVVGVPTTFIIDAEGNIRFTEVGYTTGLGLRARIWWLDR